MNQELTQDKKSNQFYQILRKHSQNQYDPLSEWEYNPDLAGDGQGRCICSTPIFHEFVIENKITGHTFTIGSECIQRWFESKIRCQKCNASLGNVKNRIKNGFFLCALCNRQRKRRIKELQFRPLLINNLNNELIHYHCRPFRSLLEDIEVAERILNASNPSQSMKDFEEFVSLHYDIQTRVE